MDELMNYKGRFQRDDLEGQNLAYFDRLVPPNGVSHMWICFRAILLYQHGP